MKNIKKYWLQPLFGFLILLMIVIPVVAWELSNNPGGKGKVVAGMMSAGVMLGYALSRGRMGFAGPIKKLTQQGDGRQAKALIALFMICSVLAGAAIIGFGEKAFGYPMKMPLGVGTILGGLIFGFGMTISTGCASGTLSDVGDGIVPAVLVLIFFMIGSAAGVGFYGTAADIDFVDGKGSALSTQLNSVSLAVIINIAILGFILLIVSFIHKVREHNKTQVLTTFGDEKEFQVFGDMEYREGSFFKSIFSYKTWKKMFAKRWSWSVVILVLSLWFAVIIIGFKQTPGVTGAYAHWGIRLTHGFGNEKILGWNKGWEMMKDEQSWQNIGIIIGALCSKLFANKFKLVGWNNQKLYNWFLFALGGFMMGVGARMARGCNFGAMFTGVTFGTGFGWVFSVFLVAGAVGASYFDKWMKHNTPNSVYKIKHNRKAK